MYYDFLVKIPAKKGKIFERTIFSYQSYVREQEAMLPFLIDIFETNTGVK